MLGSGVGILKRYIHTLLTLTRGHSTTVRDVTGNPCERSIWSLCSLYSLDALALTPSSRSTRTACDKFENMCTLPSIREATLCPVSLVERGGHYGYKLDVSSQNVSASIHTLPGPSFTWT